MIRYFIAKDSWWNELVCTGLFAIGLGVFLIILNSIISKKEEEDLEDYVQRQLTRSRSGNADLIVAAMKQILIEANILQAIAWKEM